MDSGFNHFQVSSTLKFEVMVCNYGTVSNWIPTFWITCSFAGIYGKCMHYRWINGSMDNKNTQSNMLVSIGKHVY